MPPADPHRESRTHPIFAWGLVTLHFLLAAILVLTTSRLPHSPLGITATFAGVVIAVWAWLAMGLRNIRVTPDPAEDSQLVTRGPYAWIRHPMYSGLLLCCGGLVIDSFRLWRLGLWLVLLVVLLVKAEIEERQLLRRVPGYHDYRRKTKRFLPGVY